MRAFINSLQSIRNKIQLLFLLDLDFRSLTMICLTSNNRATFMLFINSSNNNTRKLVLIEEKRKSQFVGLPCWSVRPQMPLQPTIFALAVCEDLTDFQDGPISWLNFPSFRANIFGAQTCILNTLLTAESYTYIQGDTYKLLLITSLYYIHSVINIKPSRILQYTLPRWS